MSAPQTTEITIDLPIIILKHTRINRERTTDGIRLWDKRALWTVGNRYTESEHTVIILGRENKEILTVFLYHIVIPHLSFSPWHLFHIKDYSVIGSRILLYIVKRQYMIVEHLKMTAIIIKALATVTVV